MHLKQRAQPRRWNRAAGYRAAAEPIVDRLESYVEPETRQQCDERMAASSNMYRVSTDRPISRLAVPYVRSDGQ